MSANQRRRAEELRAKYARVFKVPISDVQIEYLEGETARVQAAPAYPGLPVWTIGSSAR